MLAGFSEGCGRFSLLKLVEQHKKPFRKRGQQHLAPLFAESLSDLLDRCVGPDWHCAIPLVRTAPVN
jgi:hypothetical protein